MGLYDYRCHATGLSLRAEDAVVVLLLEEPRGAWVPASLPLRGRYNRLGTIDRVTADFHAKLLAENFEASVDSKRLSLAREAAYAWKKPGTDFSGRPVVGIDRVLQTVERATTLGSGDCKLSGRALNHALLHAGFYAAAVRALTPADPDLNTTALLERAFPLEPARWFLRELPELTTIRPEVRAALNSFHAVCAFLGPWAPARDTGQHGALETMDGYATAFARFGDVPWARAALEEARLAADHEATDLPAGWLRHARCSWFGLVLGDERFFATSHEGVREVLTRFAADVDAPFAERLELFVVQEGVPGAWLDLRALVRVKGGGETARFSDDAAKDLALEEDSTVVFQWDEVAQALPSLVGTVLPAGAPAVLRVPSARPAWLRADEQYVELIHFE